MTQGVSSVILIVDNDPMVVAALDARLTGMGFRCERAGSGAQALAQFERYEPDLVITDFNMPQGDGATFVRSVRRISSVPIIVISGCPDAAKATQWRALGVTFLRKPFDSDRLMELVREALEEPDVRDDGMKNAA